MPHFLPQIRSEAALPYLTREAHQKELERKRKQQELDNLELLARKERDMDDIINISSGDEAVKTNSISLAHHTAACDFGPLVCNVDSQRFVVNLEEELISKLKVHQVEGVKFLWGHLSNPDGFGCILADEMGLGKTLTTLVTLHALSLASVCKHALVICPSLVISTWSEQTDKWLPKSSKICNLCVISPDVPSARRYSKIHSWADEGGLCIIGYEMFRETCAQTDSPSAVLLTMTPDVVILDEGENAGLRFRMYFTE